jgi:hypothetical protein
MLLVTNNLTSGQYRIKAFTNSHNKDFLRALSIYSSNTAPALKTNTNEIIYWLDNIHLFKEERQFHVLGLYKNDNVIGYAQFMYIKNKRIIIIDYMAIEKSERRFGTFYQFIDLIKDYIETRLDFDYILTEIGYLTNSNTPSNFSKALIRLIKIEGFGVVCAKYYQPQLSPENAESQMAAQLMVYMNPSMEQVKRDTYLSWVKTIYFDHYIEWYRPFKNQYELEIYTNEVTHLFNKIKVPLNVNITFSNSIDVIDGDLPKPKGLDKISAFVNFLRLFLCLIIFILSFVGILYYIRIDITQLLIVYVVLSFLMLTIYGIFNAKAKKAINGLIEFIKAFFGKLK